MSNPALKITHKSEDGFNLHLSQDNLWFTALKPNSFDLAVLETCVNEYAPFDRGIKGNIVEVETGEVLKNYLVTWDALSLEIGCNDIKTAIFPAKTEDDALKQWQATFAFKIEQKDMESEPHSIERISIHPYLKKKYKVELTDGSVYAIPMLVIALDRAKAYKADFNDDVVDSLEQDTIPYFLDSTYAVKDWASNNMNWSDVQFKAVKEKDADIDYDDEWVNPTSYKVE